MPRRQLLDEYPMPDSELAASDMEQYGYLYDGMLPVSKERALELDAAGLTVYVLHEDNTESMVFDSDEILQHGGLFGVDCEEWEHSPGSMKRYWNARTVSWNGNRHFSPMKKTASPFIR